MSFWSKFFIALAITILATTGAVVGVFAGQKEQIDMGGSIKYTVPYFTVTFLNYDDTVFETQQVAYGKDAKKPATDPIRPGYTFKSWTDYTNITSNRRVTANWIKNEAYLTTGSKWQAIVNASAVGSQTNIEQIEFVSSVPSGATLIGSVGVTNETATTVWTEGCGVFDVKAYYTALSTGKYKISFYSPYTIYAPEDSSYLFSNSTNANSLTNLTSITFGNFNTSNVTNMKGMFGGCRSLTLLNLSSFNTSKVTNMLWMFNNCSKLTSLILSNFNTSNVTNMSGMFSNCQVLTSLDVSNFNTSKVTNMSDMFSSCKALISLNVSSFETNKVTNMSYMFNGCSKLTSLNLSNFNTSNVTSMSCMFYYCQVLTSLNLSSFVTSKVTNMYNMFYGCYSLTSLNLSSFDMSKVTNTTDMLAGRSSLTEIKTPKAIGSAAVDLPTKTNYSWFDQANTNNTYTQITSACLSKTLLLQGNKFTVTANANGGTIPTTSGWTVASGGATATKQVTYDSTYGTLPTPTKTGYTFNGWFTAQTGGSKVESSTTVKTASNHTIYAHWKEATYTITFNPNGGSVSPTTKNVTYNSTYGDLPTPTKTGYTFNGWIGKNLFNKDITPYKSNHYLRGADGVEVSYEAYHIYQIVVTPGLTLTIKNSGQSNAPGFAYYTANGTYISGQNYATNSTVTTTVPANASFLRFSVNHGESYRLDLHYFQIELGSSATSYEAYQVITYSTKVTRTSNHTLLASWTLNESYLLKDWQTALINNNANFTAANIKTIQFVNTVPSGSGYTQVSVGATTSAGTTAWIDSSGVYNVTAYVKANGSLYDIIFYSPVTIYAPVDASYLFSNSTYDSSYSNKLKNLVSISFGNFNTSKVTNMSNMFFNCSSLTSLNLSNFDTSKVTNMRYMFNICSSLTSLNLSDFNTSNVTNMSGMFDYCPSLTSLNVSNFNTSNVTNMSYMFDGCSSLTSLNVSSFNTSNVTNMAYMFNNCSSLTSLNLSSFDMSKVTNTGNMLSDCSALTEIKTPKAIGSAAVDLPTIDKRLWVDNSNVLNIYTQITTSCTNKTLNLVNAPMVTLNSNAQGILKDLDETNGTQITSNNNLNIIYTPEKHIYKLSNTASSDPYATIGQVMYLTAGKKYIMHAEIYSNSGEPITSGSIQVFYAINKGYNEANSKRFSGLSSYETFTVSTTGTYNIRFDNDYGETIWVKNFYVVEETQLTSYVSNNGTYGSLPTPTREYYTFSGWYTAPTGGTNVTETTKISSLNNVTLYAHWTEATYTITIDHNNGTGSTSTIHVPQDPKKQRDYIASLPSISYSGYKFYGLSDSNTAYNASQNLISNLAFSESGLMLCPILRNATLYGVWVPSSTSYEAMFSLYQKLNENDQDYWTFQTYLGTFDSLIHIITHSITYSGFRCTLGILKDITLSDGYTITNIPSLQIIACFGSRTITFSENNKYFIFNGSYDIKFGGNGRNLTITNSGDDPVCSISTMESMESKLYTQRFVLASGAYINYGITGLSLESSSGNPSEYGYNVLDSFGGTLKHYTIVSPLHRSVNIFGGTVETISSITGGIYFHDNPDGNIQIDAGENSLNASNSLTFFHTKISYYNVYIDRLNTDGKGFSSKTKVAIAADPTYFNGQVKSSKQYIIYEDKVAYVYPYPVVLDKNGGSGTMPTVSVNSGDKTKFTISTSKTGPLLTKNGKQLYYWSTVSTDTEASQTGVRYDAGYTYTYGGGIHPTVLYATYLTPSADSYFTFTESGSGYIVNYTNKSASLTNCVVPQYHNSKPVIGLADSCFNAASIHGILTLPSSLTSLGYASTGWMRDITKIYFPSNITSMGRCNFVACSTMQDIIINQAANFATYEGVLYSADYSRLYAVPCAKPIGFTWKNFTTASYLSLCDSSAYETLSLPSSLKTMEEIVFSYNSVKLIRIQSSSLTINSGEFSNCNNLNYILCTNKSVAVYLEGQSANKKGKFFYKTSSYASNISWTLLANNYYISSDGIYAKDPDGNIYRKYETPTGYLDIRNNVVYGFLSTVDATKYAEIDIPAGVTAINASAFQGKTALQTVNFTDTQLNTIGNYAFDGCTSLKTLNGYNRSTRVTSIGSYAFRGTKIERVIIPSTITSIGAGAFANSSAIIAEVYCSYATFGSGLFSGTGLKIIYGASSSSGMYSNLAANLGITKLEYAFFSDSNTNEAGSSLRGKTTNSYYSGTTNPKGLDYTEKTDSTPVPGYLERVRRGITLLNLRYSYAKLYLSFGTYYFSA
ncbi:MAG: BspA family leucine-rich repeat surface protein, partial [Firmicutes bacterium]|nr:BspA family leucine-rich repeat surface protein [Bacillota bacterium]